MAAALLCCSILMAHLYCLHTILRDFSMTGRNATFVVEFVFREQFVAILQRRR